MATLFMLCGLPGSGKTTVARQLEAEGALALILDEWVALEAGGSYDEELGEQIAQLQLQIAVETLRAGRDVALDWGFDSREERDRVREQAAKIGAEVRLLFLDVPRSELERRIAVRAWPKVSAESLDQWSSEFDFPDKDENPERISSGVRLEIKKHRSSGPPGPNYSARTPREGGEVHPPYLRPKWSSPKQPPAVNG